MAGGLIPGLTVAAVDCHSDCHAAELSTPRCASWAGTSTSSRGAVTCALWAAASSTNRHPDPTGRAERTRGGLGLPCLPCRAHRRGASLGPPGSSGAAVGRTWQAAAGPSAPSPSAPSGPGPPAAAPAEAEGSATPALWIWLLSRSQPAPPGTAGPARSARRSTARLLRLSATSGWPLSGDGVTSVVRCEQASLRSGGRG